MKSIRASFWVECLKVRKSKVFWLSIVFFVFVSFMMGIIVLIQQHPELSEKMGLIGTKASLFKTGEPNWENYFALLNQIIAGIGMVGFGFVTSWVFGREYAENTMKDILSLPVSRSSIVISKLLVVTIWCILLTLVFLTFGILFGYLAGISGLTYEILARFLSTFMSVSLLTILLCTPVAFFASYSRGILLPVGIIILTMIIANFSGLIGLGPYFPWSIPGSLCIPPFRLEMASYVILFITSISGLSGTLLWWRFADQK